MWRGIKKKGRKISWNPTACKKDEKAVGLESTHGFEVLKVNAFNPLAADKPLQG
jgi:hypothetical protein